MKKKRDSLLNLIMIFIVFCLGLYIVFGKIIFQIVEESSEKMKNASKNNAMEEVEVAPNSTYVSDLYYSLSGHSKLNGSPDDSWIYNEDFYNYSNKLVNISNLSNEQILSKAFWRLYYIDKVEVSTINKKMLEKSVYKLYGKKVKYNDVSFKFDIYSCVYDEDYNCGVTSSKHSLLSKENYKISKAVTTSAALIIYEYFYYPEFVDGKYIIYNTFDKEKVIATLTIDEYNNTDIISKYKGDLYLYKHTFVSVGTGDYYWSSTDIVK